MTMGALHEGHAELIRAARALADGVVVTIFVNPLQFAPGEDLDRYPRTLDADVKLCGAEGVDVVYVPPVSEVYPAEALVTVEPGPLSAILEGASRPTHFAGVLTVVAKLLHQVRPDLAVFGEKDYQQLVLIRQMVSDLDFDVDILGMPTVREADGLAMSSRNAYLTTEQRRAAEAVPAALRAGRDAGAEGPTAVLSATAAVLDGEPALDVDYVALRSPDLGDEPLSGAARLLVAVRVGATRLIDNAPVDLGSPDPAREH
jgi:pantoate--beta-alanine ligase